MTLLKINRLLPIYISIVPLKFEVDIQSQERGGGGGGGGGGGVERSFQEQWRWQNGDVYKHFYEKRLVVQKNPLLKK